MQSDTSPQMPHSLWRQSLGMLVWVGLLGGFIAYSTGGVPGAVYLWILGGATFADAWRCGIFKSDTRKSLLNMSPMGWGVAMTMLLVLAYPLYLANRSKLRTRDGGYGYVVVVIVLGGLVYLGFVAGLVANLMAAS